MGSYLSHSTAPSASPPPPPPIRGVEESRLRDLPLELLISVIRCLPLVDRVCFGCVCSAFRKAVQYYNLSSPPPRTTLPWLLLPDESTAAAYAFFSVADRKTYRILQPAGTPAVDNRTWLGSSDGWLVALDLQGSQLHLINPLTRSQILLPPLLSRATRRLEFSKAVVSWRKKLPSSSSSKNLYTVVLLSAKRLVCAGSGDRTTWTSFGTRDTYSDATICNTYLYTMESKGTVEVWDLAAAAGGGGRRPDLAMTIIMPDYLGGFASFTKYLVGSSDVDVDGSSVLQVWRSREFSQVAFKIFGLDPDKEEWVEKKSLDGRVLFLNSCSSMSSSTSSSSSSSEDLYSDCIFFDRLTSEGKRESMVFRLKDKSAERVLLHGSRWNPSPIWIAPDQSIFHSAC